jgi:RHS repeat-associated protein
MIHTTTYPLQTPRYYNGGYRYFFNGQEADNEVLGEGGLAGYEFREYDTRLGRWWGVDRKAAKYPSLSPYQFCAGNPIVFVDPRGDSIVPASKDKWNKQKSEITATIVNRAFQVVTNTQDYSPSYTKKSIMSLFETLSVMDQMERHPIWWYSLSSKRKGTTGYTKLTRDSKSNMSYLFRIGYVNTANFVHEVTHCGQFLSGKIVFEEDEGKFGAYVDVYDEIDAYKSQYYYNQNSLPLNNYPIFTVKWLRDIKDDNDKYPYRKDGIISFDKFATKEIMQEAYPEIFEMFEDMKGPLMCKPRTVSN